MKPKQNTQTRALRVEIVKPLGREWVEVGGHLRALRFAAHWVINEAVLASIESDRRAARGEKVGGAKAFDEGEVTVLNPGTAGYRAAEELALPDCRAWAAKKIRGKRKNETDDATGEQLKESGLLARIASLDVPGGIRSGWAQQANALYSKWAKNRGSERIPSTASGAPIVVRAQETEVSLDAKGVVITWCLYAGRGGSVRFAVKCGRGDHYGRLKELAHGTAKVGDSKIVYDERQKKWFAFVAYTTEKPAPSPECDPKRALIVHRGVRNALTIFNAETGASRMIPGQKLIETKRRLVARRHSIQRVARAERGSGVHGHGRHRRHAAPDALADKEARVVRTWCQQMGAEVAKLARFWSCGTIVIEDYGGIEQTGDVVQRYLDKFPFCQLKQSIEWSLEKKRTDIDGGSVRIH